MCVGGGVVAREGETKTFPEVGSVVPSASLPSLPFILLYFLLPPSQVPSLPPSLNHSK